MPNEIKPEQVPHSAMNALLLALRRREGGKEAIAAALNAWPGMHMEDESAPWVPRLILPLPTEASDGNYDYAGGL